MKLLPILGKLLGGLLLSSCQFSPLNLAASVSPLQIKTIASLDNLHQAGALLNVQLDRNESVYFSVLSRSDLIYRLHSTHVESLPAGGLNRLGAQGLNLGGNNRIRTPDLVIKYSWNTGNLYIADASMRRLVKVSPHTLMAV